MKFMIQEDPKYLAVEAETREEVREVIDHFKLDPFDCVEAKYAGRMVHKAFAGREHEWYSVSCELGPEWLKPYLDNLQRLAGKPVVLEHDIDIPPYGGRYEYKLCHTHLVHRAVARPEGFAFDGIVWSKPWNGMTPEVYAGKRFVNYCQTAVGHYEERVPEYSETGSGLYRRNVNFGQLKAPPKPGLTSPLILEALAGYWLAHQATPGQREALEQSLKTYQGTCKTSGLGDMLERTYGVLHPTWDKPLKLEEFHSL